MVRKLLLLSCVVSLVFGFTLAAYAQEADSAKKPWEKKEKAKLTAACTCKWDLKVNFKPGGGKEFHDVCFFEKFTEKLELPDKIEEVVVKTELLDPFTKKLSADCKLDKKFKNGKFTGYFAACQSEFCFIKVDLKKVFDFDDDDDDDDDWEK